MKEQFAWRHFYWYLTNEGIQYLRDYLHLPPEIVPATLRRSRPETGRPRPKGERAEPRHSRRGRGREGRLSGWPWWALSCTSASGAARLGHREFGMYGREQIEETRRFYYFVFGAALAATGLLKNGRVVKKAVRQTGEMLRVGTWPSLVAPGPGVAEPRRDRGLRIEGRLVPSTARAEAGAAPPDRAAQVLVLAFGQSLQQPLQCSAGKTVCAAGLIQQPQRTLSLAELSIAK